MSRAVDGTRRKDHRKKILKLAKGYWGRRHSNYKVAKDAVAKALSDAYKDRRDKSRFVEGMTKAGIAVNRKVLADLAISDPAAFTAVVEKAKAALQA